EEFGLRVELNEVATAVNDVEVEVGIALLGDSDARRRVAAILVAVNQEERCLDLAKPLPQRRARPAWSTGCAAAIETGLVVFAATDSQTEFEQLGRDELMMK